MTAARVRIPLVLALALALAALAATASGQARREAARAPRVASRAPSAEAPASMAQLARRLEELRLHRDFGDDWHEALVEADDAEIDAVLRRHGGSWRAKALGRHALRKPQNRRSLDWYLDLWADPSVRRIEPNPRAVHPGCRQMSIDILETGTQLIPDLAAQPALRLTSAQTLDASGVVVAIVDSGVAEIDGLAGRLLPSIDALHPHGPRVIDDTAELASNALDVNGHGTAMASLVASVADGVGILSVRVVKADCEGTAFDVADGIQAAAEGGAEIVLVSLSTRHDSPLLRRTVADVTAAGVLVVAAAGNEGEVEYPAAYPGVLAVTAIGADGLPPWFAPLDDVGLAAPGVGVRAIGPDSAVALTGTSPAAALAAGAAARAVRLSASPDPQAWVALLRSAARPSDPAWEGRLGAGILHFTPLRDP